MGGKDQVESLLRELKLMRSFLKEADSRKVCNDVLRECVAEIRELTYDAEEVIETFASKVTQNQRIDNLRRLGERGGSSSSTERWEARWPYPHVINDNVVGLDDDIKKLVSILVDGEIDCRVVSAEWEKALFHQQRDEGNGGEMMEDVAVGCLVELVERWMVQVGERGPTLKIKTYRMHDLMRGCKLPNAIDLSKFTKLRKLEIFGSLDIEDCKEGLDKNLPIITSKYLQSLSIDGGGIDPKLLAHLLSSCIYLCELILDGKMDVTRVSPFPFKYSLHMFEKVQAWGRDPVLILEKLPNLRTL
ncbi:hypothetical protein GOBAR_AA04146 [Gossypium barbadense]|uniref:Uncharacterized protein n=1 Tax=Gossypium barbadense TaxID=3634 RepID=A0A2P5YLH8_GOSBA|nr:hypothetical protein GOBAR_AA04146 [Gossypium barbadense]